MVTLKTEMDDTVEKTGTVIPNDNNPAFTPEVVTIEGVDYKNDADGNIVNDKGEVVYTKEQYQALSADNTPTLPENIQSEVTIEGDSRKLYLHKDGHLVDEAGNTVMSKEDFDKANEGNQTSIDDILLQASAISGLELVDEEGKPLTFELTPEGIAKRDTYLRDHFYNLGKEEFLTNLAKEDPDFIDLYQYKKAHGSLEGYTKQVDYTKVELTDDEHQQISVITAREKLAGRTDEEIQSYINYLKANKTLKDYADKSLKILADNQVKTQQAKIENENAIKRDQQAKIEKFYGIKYENGKEVDLNIEGSIYDKIVKKGTIGELTIPATGIVVKTDKGSKTFTRKDIFSYISKPVDKYGNSQADIDDYNKMRDTDKRLFRYLFNLTDGNIESLVKRQVASAIGKKITIKPVQTTVSSNSRVTGKGITIHTPADEV